MADDSPDARFGELFRETAVAWRVLSSYPRGHPSAAEALGKAHAALRALLAATGPVDIGATREALLWSDRRFASPTAAQLARLLRRRGAAGVHFDPGVTVDELETFLRALTVDARAARERGSLAAELAAAGLVRLRASDLDLSALALVDAEDQTTAPEAGSFASRVVRRLLAAGGPASEVVGSNAGGGRSAEELLQAVLDPAAAGGASPEQVAAAGAALRAVAEELGDAPDRERAAAVAAIHGRLHAAGRARLIQELATAVASRGSARESLALLSAALPPQVVSELRLAIRQAAAAGRGPVAAPEGTAAPTLAQLAALRRAFAEEDVDGFRDADTPVDVLAGQLELPGDRADVALPPGAARIAEDLRAQGQDGAALAVLVDLAGRPELPAESLPGVLRRVEAAWLLLVSSGRLRDAARVAERVRRDAGDGGAGVPAFRESLGRMSGRAAMEALARSVPDVRDESVAGFRALVGFLEPSALGHLLDVLTDEDDRRRRLRLLDLLGKLGWVVAREAEARLSDPRWYVVRNMLQLLRRVGDVKSVPAVRACVEHPDLRVRLEAIHNLFAFDSSAPRELLRRTLDDPDLRQAEAAMELAGQYGISEAVEPIVAYLRARDPLGRRRAVRLKAIRALAAIGDPAALDGLAHFRSRLPFVAPAAEERRELYRSLPAYPEAARLPWIESGRRSRDAEIRRLSAVMAPEQGGTP